jgi:hypothetical protein
MIEQLKQANKKVLIMFNVRSKKSFAILLLFISLSLTCGCSSKPSEETMKDIILNNSYSFIFQNSHSGEPLYSNIAWDNFHITKKFNKKIDDENYYCIEVNFKFTCDFYNRHTMTTEKNVFGRQEERYSFIRHGNEWHGQTGWGN